MPGEERIEEKEEKPSQPLPPAGTFTIRRRRIAQVDIVEVFEHELDDLASAYAEANQSLNFAIGLLGACFTLAVPIFTNPSLGSQVAAILAGAAFASGALALWFFVQWIRSRRRGPELLARIKGRKPIVTLTEEIEAHSETPEQ